MHDPVISVVDKTSFSALNFLNSEPAKILAIEANPFSRLALVDLLRVERYQVIEISSGENIFNRVLETNPDLILLDIALSDINSFEVCRQLKQDRRTCFVPIIFTTVSEERSLRIKCFEAGGDDILVKPLDSMMLSARVKSLTYQKRLHESLDQTEQVLFLIARALESRYARSTKSAVKIASLAREFGTYLNLKPIEIDSLVCSAHLHDVGTVTIPDSIILKKGKLTEEERETLKQHVLIGEQICQPLQNRPGVLPIIRHHHERWDGSGYPDGLVGNEIPWLAQIFQILDIYHALTSERPHKKALTPKKALAIIAEETIKGWRNPELIKKFTKFVREQKM